MLIRLMHTMAEVLMKTGHRDAYINGLRAAEAEGFVQGKAGFSQEICVYKRHEFRCAWYDGWMRGRQTAKPEDHRKPHGHKM